MKEPNITILEETLQKALDAAVSAKVPLSIVLDSENWWGQVCAKLCIATLPDRALGTRTMFSWCDTCNARCLSCGTGGTKALQDSTLQTSTMLSGQG